MEKPEPKVIESQLRRLERRDTWMWALAALLMVALAATLASIHFAGAASEGFLDRDTGYAPVVGLGGLIALFSLYMLLKQRQLQQLRTQLFHAMVLQESLRSRLSGLSSLFEGVAQVGVSFELEAMLQTLTDHVRTALLAERASLFLLDADTRELQCVAVSGRDPDIVRQRRIPVGEGIAGLVAAKGEPLALTPDKVTQRFPSAARPARDIRAGLCVPLALPGQVIGVLNVTRIDHEEPFTDQDARVVTVFAAHIAIAIRRVNERRQAEEARRAQEERQRQSQKMESLGRLAGGVAHDYNNLLTVILSYGAKLMRGLGPEDPMRQCAVKIVDAGERCAALTRQLVTFSRKQVVEMKRLDLNACVTEMNELLRRVIGENIELVAQLDPRLEGVRADHNQIEQVIMNLVVHARDALPMGGRVTVTTSNLALDAAVADRYPGARAGAYVVLTVHDTGHGIDAAAQTRVFEPYFAGEDQGARLGLSTVYGIVQQCGGFISVESQPGQGTTFRVGLPSAAAAELAPAAATPAPAPSSGGTILVVEDEEEVRILVREMLEGDGHRVLEAQWAGEAVMMNEMHRGEIDLMVTDVIMPGESGGELAQWMARVRPEMPVLYMSGYTDDAIVRHGVQHEGAAFLQKPFTEKELLARVRALLAAGVAARPAPPLDQAA